MLFKLLIRYNILKQPPQYLFIYKLYTYSTLLTYSVNGEVDARKSVRGSDKEEKNNILKKMTLTLKNLFTLIKPLLLFGY